LFFTELFLFLIPDAESLSLYSAAFNLGKDEDFVSIFLSTEEPFYEIFLLCILNFIC
jgi:hypothetical protein